MQAEIVQMKDWANKSKNQKVFYFLLDEKLRWCRLIDELEKLKDQQDNTMSVRVIDEKTGLRDHIRTIQDNNCIDYMFCC